MQFLKNLDTDIFLFLNGLNAKCLDPIMKVITSHEFWIPVFIIILFLLIKKFKTKFWIPTIFIIACFFITDTSSSICKEKVKRLRPSQNIELADKIHLVDNYKGGEFGYFSGHACNSFGLALITLLILKNRKFTIFILIWATLVTYSRIYMGVHYPGDTITGIIIGLLIARLVYFSYMFTLRKLKLNL